MPFAVSQWPYSPDPRTAEYALTGFDFGQIPPWRWFMQTTDALDPYGILNTGLVWERTAHTIASATFAPIVPTPGITDPVLTFFGTLLPSGGVTMEFFCSFFITGADPATAGFINALYPLAIAERSFTMVNQTLPPPSFIPNPLVITPRLWDLD
jgi:hypothetical protein